MSKNPVLYKTLVVGVIALFLGVGINPAIATVEPDVDITDKSNVESLVAQIKDVVSEILVKYGYIPTVRGLCNVILNTLGLVGYMIICIFLIMLFIPVFILHTVFLLLRLEYLRQYMAMFTVGIGLLTYVFCPPYNEFISKLSFQSIYTMLETKPYPTYQLDDCPCLQEGGTT